MSKLRKFYERLMGGKSDADIPFEDIRLLLKHFGFTERVRGDHHIFSKDGIVEILNLQSRGKQAKPYQVKQVRNLILKYHIDFEDET